MEKMSEIEREFFDKVGSKGSKKISVNLSKETIGKIDELTDIFGLTRTVVIESIVMSGVKPYIDVIEEACKKNTSSPVSCLRKLVSARQLYPQRR